MAKRALTEEIPEYLLPYIAKQNPGLYTAIDHASWRFILKISRPFFSKHAHKKYVDGLRETGISLERIPLIEEMDECLRNFNWRAVAVSGFIPPAVFMEFLSLGILPIACEMRKLEHLSYTPAPDIVHEAAGHAPIIADPEYSEYLHQYGEISQKAIMSAQDMDVYNAIRELSETKEDPKSTPALVKSAQESLDRAIAAVDHVSEATLLSRMGWWTFEYGLIGELKNPKIYGAGLLSSIGESYHCLGSEVRKIPFTVDCVQTSYDITRPQPQLFVAPDFATLSHALVQLGETMAFKKGGLESLEKAKKSRLVNTVVLDSGIQISSVLADVLRTPSGEPCYLRFQGPTCLAYEYRSLPGHSPNYHSQGFGTPIGLIRGLKRSAAEITEPDLRALGFTADHQGRMEFESGVVVEGIWTDRVQRDAKNLVLTFKDCKVTRGSEVLFQPDWGTFDMACGKAVPSVFGGPADRKQFLGATGGFKQPPRQQKSNLTRETEKLNELYSRVRRIRESTKIESLAVMELMEIEAELSRAYPEDWLLRYELLEISAANPLGAAWETSVRAKLDEISRSSRDKAEMISRGLEVL